MELLLLKLPQVSQERASRIHTLMVQGMNRLHNPKDGVTITLSCADKDAEIRCTANLPGFEITKKGNAALKRLAESLAEAMMAETERQIVRSIISKEYAYRDVQEIAKIEKYCEQLLYPADEANADTARRRKKKLTAALHAYLQEYSRLHWKGFVDFRLKEFRDDLREVVEYAIDEYLMEKQYQEFISLLKYFVYIQEAKIPVAHLMHKGGHDFDLLNEQMVPIDTSQYDTFTVELLDQEINFEDMVVSALITVSPETIYVHTHEPEQQVIKTIMNIFEGRAQLCTSCKACQAHSGSGTSFTLDL